MGEKMTPEQMAARLEKLEKEAELREKNNKLDKESVEYAKKKNETADEYVKRLLEEQDIKGREIRLEVDRAALANDRLEMENQLFILKEEYEKMSQAALTAQEEGNHELFQQYQNNIATHEAEIALLEEKGVIANKLAKSDKKAKKELEGALGSIQKKSLFFTQAEGTFVGTFFNIASAMKEAKNPTEVLTASLGKYFNLQTLAVSVVTKVVESTLYMAKALDESNAKFAAATGLGNKYMGTLLEMRQEGNTLGVTFENAGSALEGLTENMVGFVRMSKQAQVELSMTVARFQRIGIDANTSAQSINNFTLNMGKSEKQAMQMSKELALMGQSAGISAGKMTKDFQTAFKSLAVYGDKSIEVFQGLSSAARAAGVEVSTLTSLAGKFDTFASSAETVGKLNALLGSQLSSTEMLMMTEDKRVETLVQQVQAQGVNFKDMNKFQQMAIANAAGISDMNEAQRVFGMNMKDYKKYRKDMERQENIQQRFNEAIEATIPLQEKMQIFMTNFAQAVMPLVEGMEMFLDFMIYITSNKTVMGWVSLASAIGLVAFAIWGGLKVKRTYLATTEALAGAKTLLTQASQRQVAANVAEDVQQTKNIAKDIVETQTETANAGAKNLSANGSMNLGRSSALGGQMAGAGALGMLKFALAILMIGAGIYLAAKGIGYMVSQFIELTNVGDGAIGTIISFAFALSTLMATAGLMGAAGAGGLIVAMGSFAAGLYMISSILEDNEALQEGLENLALVTTGQGAAAMKKGGSRLAADIKTAVSAAMTQRMEVIIKIKDEALKTMVEDIVVNSISNDDKIARAIVSIG
jgi:hypothetical protein